MRKDPFIRPLFVTSLLAVSLALASHLAAAEEAASSNPGTAAGAQTLLAEFVKPGADCAALTRELRPTAEDYTAVFEPDAAAKVSAMYEPAWEAGKIMVAPKPGQTVVKVMSATTDEMRSWSGNADEFPGGWKKIAPSLKPGLTLYRFKLLEPGKDAGMTWDGLIHVNGHWRIFPKAWRAMAE